jgi:hypothetical protein
MSPDNSDVVANTRQGSSGSVGKEPREKTSNIVATRSAGESTVVLRASVEHYGAVGDTELTLTVKWPAGSISTQPRGSAPHVGDSKPRNENQPANLPNALIVQSLPDPSNEPNAISLADASTKAAEGNYVSNQPSQTA